MHIGKNIDYEYSMNGVVLESVEAEMDIGIMMIWKHPASAYANKILGMIYRTIVNKQSDIMVKLYKSLVRPHVEYCTAAWSRTYTIKDKELIEKIQHRFTKMITQVKHLSYTDGLLK